MMMLYLSFETMSRKH